MLSELLSIVVLVGSGTVAGVLFAVALSVLPALFAMPADRYVYAHRLLGRRWDPTMPIIVLTSTATDIALALLAGSGTVLFATAAMLLLAVSAVSHFCNVPINRAVKSLDPARIPADWRDPRPLWRRWHLLRTVLALLAVVVNAVAVVAA
ncbi:hypothetical protein T261_0033 [Streptomyces lydicus]|nr:hypothetical protein T261_0033 [Streptomyces lydicus]